MVSSALCMRTGYVHESILFTTSIKPISNTNETKSPHDVVYLCLYYLDGSNVAQAAPVHYVVALTHTLSTWCKMMAAATCCHALYVAPFYVFA